MNKTQQIAFLHSERLSIQELALAVGMPANRVRWALKELGVRQPQVKRGHKRQVMSSPL